MQLDPDPPPPSALAHVRATLLTGLALVLPLVVTVWIFSIVLLPLDAWLQPVLARTTGHTIPGLGLLTLIVLLYVVGLVGRNVLGRMFFGMLEAVFRVIPGANTVYHATKELLGAFNLNQSGAPAFREVCLLEYPCRGLYALGFVTNRVRLLEDGGEREAVTIFIPNPPNPATGQFVVAPRCEVIGVNLTVEEGVKMVLSGGLVAPGALRLHPNPEHA